MASFSSKRTFALLQVVAVSVATVSFFSKTKAVVAFTTVVGRQYHHHHQQQPQQQQHPLSIRSIAPLAQKLHNNNNNNASPPPRTHSCTTSVLAMSTSATSYMDALSEAAAQNLGRPVTFQPATGGGASGGGGASTSAIEDTTTGKKYFVKAATGGLSMLRAEYEGVKAMFETSTIRVPQPIAYGTYNHRAFVIFEYLQFTGGGSQYELGKALARMHRHVAPEKDPESGRSMFGFHIDNTCGATHQPNQWTTTWVEFWDTHRLGHMLDLTYNAGWSEERVEALREKTKDLLAHNPAPSLVHGDLWGGNKGFCKDGDQVVPVIFDPATYYGDREVDIAMTYLFGGFTGDFYKGYEEEWPLPPGHERRRTVYNLYHILNHEVLFGGYAGQARGMMESIMRM